MARDANMCRLIVDIDDVDAETLRQAALAVITLCKSTGVHPADAADAGLDICECLSLGIPVAADAYESAQVWDQANDLAREICCPGWPTDCLPREPLRMHYYHLTAKGEELPAG